MEHLNDGSPGVDTDDSPFGLTCYVVLLGLTRRARCAVRRSTDHRTDAIDYGDDVLVGLSSTEADSTARSVQLCSRRRRADEYGVIAQDPMYDAVRLTVQGRGRTVERPSRFPQAYRVCAGAVLELPTGSLNGRSASGVILYSPRRPTRVRRCFDGSIDCTARWDRAVRLDDGDRRYHRTVGWLIDSRTRGQIHAMLHDAALTRGGARGGSRCWAWAPTAERSGRPAAVIRPSYRVSDYLAHRDFTA